MKEFIKRNCLILGFFVAIMSFMSIAGLQLDNSLEDLNRQVASLRKSVVRLEKDLDGIERGVHHLEQTVERKPTLSIQEER